MKRLREKGFTMLEVVIGTGLLLMSTSFVMIMFVQYVRSSNQVMAQQTLNLVEESISRSLLTYLNGYFSTQTRYLTGSYCNFNRLSLMSGLAGTLPFGLQAVQALGTNPQNTPPDIPDIQGYSAARTRCLTRQTTTQVAGGNFQNTNSLYFCALLRPPVVNSAFQSTINGSSFGSQTILAEFTYQITDEHLGQPVPCSTLLDYPMSAPPSTSSALMANLYFSLHTINRVGDTRNLAANSEGRKNINYRHISSALHASWPYNPPDQRVFQALYVSPHAAHSNGRLAPPNTGTGSALYVPLGSTADCGGAVCTGRQMFFGLPSTTFPPTGGNVITGFYMAPPPVIPGSGHIVGGNPGLVPAGAGWTPLNLLADCWGNFCFGNLRIYQRAQPYTSLPFGTPMLSALYVTEPGSHGSLALDCTTMDACCPKGFTYVTSIADCSSGVSNQPALACAGKQNVCARWVNK